MNVKDEAVFPKLTIKRLGDVRTKLGMTTVRSLFRGSTQDTVDQGVRVGHPIGTKESLTEGEGAAQESQDVQWERSVNRHGCKTPTVAAR